MTQTLIRMPKLADTLVEGRLGQWLKQVGDQVGQGEPLASIETDKVTTELTSPAAGTLLEVLVPEGQTVPIETVIARIGDPTEAAAEPSPAAPPPAAAPPAASVADGATEQQRAPSPRPPSEGSRMARRPTTVAARLLAEHGLAAEQIPSTSERLTKDDVLAFIRDRVGSAPTAATSRPAAMPPSTPGADGDFVPLTSMRRAIADHMTRARHTIPHGQSVVAADLTRLVTWRDQHKAAFLTAEGANLTFTVLFVYALSRELAARHWNPVDLGVAVALDGGLIVPVLRRVDLLSLGATARGIADLATRARASKLTPDETQGAQMTVTNVGTFGNLTASPIVPLGQTAILGPGLVDRRPLPGPDGGVRIGWRCLLSLMFDRRALTDFEADRLLRGVVNHLAAISERQ